MSEPTDTPNEQEGQKDPEKVEDVKEPTTNVDDPAEPGSNDEVPTDDGSEPPADEVTDYPEYADQPTLNQVVNVLKEANLPLKDANLLFKDFQATLETDPDKAIATLDRKVLEEKLGKSKADLVLILAESYVKDFKSDLKKAEDLAVSVVGSKENLDKIRAWAAAREQTDPEFAKELADLRNVIAQNTPAATRSALRDLYDMYKLDPDASIRASMVTGDKQPAAPSLQPLSRSEFTDLVYQAMKDGTYNTKQAELYARRRLGKKQGI